MNLAPEIINQLRELVTRILWSIACLIGKLLGRGFKKYYDNIPKDKAKTLIAHSYYTYLILTFISIGAFAAIPIHLPRLYDHILAINAGIAALSFMTIAILHDWWNT